MCCLDFIKKMCCDLFWHCWFLVNNNRKSRSLVNLAISDSSNWWWGESSAVYFHKLKSRELLLMYWNCSDIRCTSRTWNMKFQTKIPQTISLCAWKCSFFMTSKNLRRQTERRSQSDLGEFWRHMKKLDEGGVGWAVSPAGSLVP